PFVGNDVRRTAVAQAGTEEIDLFFLTVHKDCGLPPIDLHRVSRRKPKRDEHLTDFPRRLHVMHKFAHGGFAAAEATLFYEPLVDAA
ncbi:MAG: hypothetical protein PHG57_06560, partial [Eubacteriales bacterium]|nr:hypothetical protein [Eubacteriales bacterium]